jgi:uncharacterized membrane protein YoaK (UPF0700 family)
MKLKERDGLVVVLAATAGSTDAWSYFGLGHVFIANMTGNTVLLGAAISHAQRAEIARPLFAVTFYVLGVFVGTWLLDTCFRRLAGGGAEGGAGKRSSAGEQVWPRAVSWVLCIESLLLVAGAATWAYHQAPGRSTTPGLRHGLVGLAAVALGLQSAAMQSLKLPGIVTTYITGTWTTLVAGVSRLATGKKADDGTKTQLRMQAAVLTAYCASAAFSGLLFKLWPPGLGVLPALAVSLVAGYGLLTGPGRLPGAKV